MRDFIDFLGILKELKKNGWVARLDEYPCTNHGDDHRHIRLQLGRQGIIGGKEWLSPLEAISYFMWGNCNCEFSVCKDSNISLHGIDMATSYVNWLRSGYHWYAQARLEIMEVFGITEEQVLKIAPRPRSVRTPI